MQMTPPTIVWLCMATVTKEAAAAARMCYGAGRGNAILQFFPERRRDPAILLKNYVKRRLTVSSASYDGRVV